MNITTKYTDYDDLLKNADFLVEATSYKQTKLWEKYKELCRWERCRVRWEARVGHLGKRPIVLSIMHAKIKGKVVVFWFPTSSLIDYDMIGAWLNKKSKGRSVDVENFYLLFQYIKEEKS